MNKRWLWKGCSDMYRQITRTRPNKMESNFHRNMRKGKAQILALNEKEKSKIYTSLNVYDRQLFDRISNYCYSTGA